MIRLFAQPYDISATGFFFENAEDYAAKASTLRNGAGQLVEEFELEFIDGESIDAALFEAVTVNPATLATFLERVTIWSDDEKRRLIVAVRECGYAFDLETGTPDDFDVDLYHVDSLRELAEQFVDDGVFGDIPDNIRCYLDFDAIAHDLRFDYSETTIAGNRLVYRCG